MTRSRALKSVICAGVLLTLATSGCTKTVDGAAIAAETPDQTGSHAQRELPAAVLESLLLSVDRLVALAGGTNMALVVTADSTADASNAIDDRTCLGVGSVGDVAIYSNSGYEVMRGNQFSTPNAVQADVTQLVTSFTTAADAQALLQRARQDWQRCANRRYGFHSSNGNHSYFDTQDLRGIASRIEMSMSQEEDPRWGCSHAMTVQNNVVTEGRVCLLSKETAPAVNNLLDQVVARIPQ
jgi:hypothetical protein